MLQQYLISGKVFASDGVTPYPNVKVRVRNMTRKSSEITYTLTDGSYSVDLANFPSQYSNSDSIRIEATIGSFFQYTTHTVDTGGASPTLNITLGAETGTEILDIYRVKEELISFFRRNLTDPKDRAVRKVQTFTGDGSTLSFEISETTAKAVESVKVAGTAQTEYTSYFVDYQDKSAQSKPVIYFLSPPANGSVIDVTYQYGSSWIYSDRPRIDIQISDYPRTTVEIIGTRTEELGLGATSNMSDLLVTMTAWSENATDLTDIITEARKLIMENKQNFYNFKLAVPVGTGVTINSPNRDERILQSSFDFMIRFKTETIN